MRPIHVLCVLMLWAVGCASGPLPARPDPTPSEPRPVAGLSADRLPLGTTTSDMTMVEDGERRPIGTAVTSLGRALLNGRPVLRMVLTQQVAVGTLSDTLDVDPETLRPIRYRFHNPSGDGKSIRTDYGPGARVGVTVVSGGVASTVDTTLASPPFHAGFQAFVPALPLADGYAAQIPVFHYERGALTVGVRVIGRDEIERGGERRPVWTVEFEGATGQRAILSIDQETGHTWRVTSEIAPGARFEQVAR